MDSQTIIQNLTGEYGSANWQNWSVRPFQWYDYCRYNPAGGNINIPFFSVVLGNMDPVSGRQKTLEQTNMETPRSFGQQFFALTEICMDVKILSSTLWTDTGASADLAVLTGYSSGFADAFRTAIKSLYNTGVLIFNIGDKNWNTFNTPLLTLPSGFGIKDYDDNTGTDSADPGTVATTFGWLPSNPGSNGTFLLSPPQIIEPERTFEIKLDFPDTAYPAPALTDTWLEFVGTETTPAIEIGVILKGLRISPNS